MELKTSQMALIAIWMIIGVAAAIEENIAVVILSSSVIIGLFIDKSGYKKVGD